LPSCQLHISVNRTAQIYLELHFCVELHTKKALNHKKFRNHENDSNNTLVAYWGVDFTLLFEYP